MNQTSLLLERQPKITRVDRHGARYYQVEGQSDLYPSVTSILGVISKPKLIPWARNVATDKFRDTLLDHLQVEGPLWAVNEETIDEWAQEARRRPDAVRDEAADYGTRAHILIDQILRGEGPTIPPEMEQVVNAFLDWEQQSGLTIQLSEQMVYSTTLKYAGTMDALAYNTDGEFVALDWKTGKALYIEAALQVAAYAFALQDMTGQEVKEAWVVRFGKGTPEFEVRKVEHLSLAFNIFLDAKHLKEGLHQEQDIWKSA